MPAWCVRGDSTAMNTGTGVLDPPGVSQQGLGTNGAACATLTLLGHFQCQATPRTAGREGLWDKTGTGAMDYQVILEVFSSLKDSMIDSPQETAHIAELLALTWSVS